MAETAVNAPQVDPARVKEILAAFPKDPTSLIMAMQAIQKEYNYLPRPALDILSVELGVPAARIYRVATFYASFSLEPRGRHIIKVCMGTACHVRGAARLHEAVLRDTQMPEGEITRPDLEYTVEPVNCLGACALGPLVEADGEYFGNMAANRVPRMLKKITEE